MHEGAPDVHTTPDFCALAHILARYREPNCARGVLELVITAVPFVLIWILMWATLDAGYWICLLLAVPAAGFLVRAAFDYARDLTGVRSPSEFLELTTEHARKRFDVFS
jgi:hypothetical protein